MDQREAAGKARWTREHRVSFSWGYGVVRPSRHRQLLRQLRTLTQPSIQSHAASVRRPSHFSMKAENSFQRRIVGVTTKRELGFSRAFSL